MTNDELTELVQVRLASMLNNPAAWGPPIAVELQALLAIDVLLGLKGHDREHVDGATARYHAFLEEVVPIGIAMPLAIRLDLMHEATEDFVHILNEFAKREGV